jgi:hypothetical protein
VSGGVGQDAGVQLEQLDQIDAVARRKKSGVSSSALPFARSRRRCDPRSSVVLDP